MSDLGSSVTPPTAERAYRRARVLLAVTARSLFELLPERWNEVTRLRTWMVRETLWAEAEPAEVELLSTAPGALDARDAIDGGWRIEGVAVLCWALGLAPLPGPDEQAEPSRYRAALGFLASAPSITFSLRPEDELARCFSDAWEIRRCALAQLADRTATSTDVEPPTTPDLAVEGRALWEASEEEVRRVASAAHERCIGAGWLLGRAASYAEVASTL